MGYKQGSIEWLVEQLKSKYDIDIDRLSVTDKAKAMHKEEIIDAVEWGNRKGYDEHKLTCIYDEDEQYYNELYGNDKQ
jgi:hypothetical protein